MPNFKPPALPVWPKIEVKVFHSFGHISVVTKTIFDFFRFLGSVGPGLRSHQSSSSSIGPVCPNGFSPNGHSGKNFPYIYRIPHAQNVRGEKVRESGVALLRR